MASIKDTTTAPFTSYPPLTLNPLYRHLFSSWCVIFSAFSSFPSVSRSPPHSNPQPVNVHELIPSPVMTAFWLTHAVQHLTSNTLCEDLTFALFFCFFWGEDTGGPPATGFSYWMFIIIRNNKYVAYRLHLTGSSQPWQLVAPRRRRRVGK